MNDYGPFYVKHVPENSIVCLSDGQVGYVGHGTIQGKYLIVWIQDGKLTGRRVVGNELVKTIKYASSLAQDELRRIEATK